MADNTRGEWRVAGAGAHVRMVTGWATACIPWGGADRGLPVHPDAGSVGGVRGRRPRIPDLVGAYVSLPGGSSEAPKPNNADGSTAEIGSDPASRKTIKTAVGHTLQFEDAADEEAVHIQDGKHGHRITLDKNGVAVTDGEHGHRITLDSDGITVEYQGGDTLTIDASGIHLGGTSQHLVHGDALKLNVTKFIAALMTHTHVGNLGAPTPPVKPMSLDVPYRRNTPWDRGVMAMTIGTTAADQGMSKEIFTQMDLLLAPPLQKAVDEATGDAKAVAQEASTRPDELEAAGVRDRQRRDQPRHRQHGDHGIQTTGDVAATVNGRPCPPAPPHAHPVALSATQQSVTFNQSGSTSGHVS